MSAGTLLLAIFLILYGLSTLGVLAVSGFILGLVALLAGILLLVEGLYHPLTIYNRR